MPYPIKPHLCKVCGDDKSDNFRSDQKSTCKKCMYIRIKSKNYKVDKAYYKRYARKNIFSIRVYHAKIRAKSKNRDFDIDESYLVELCAAQNNRCAYSNREFDNGSKLNSVSIDRIDSSKGYVKGNVQLVTSAINKMKSDMSDSEFLNLIKDVFNNFNI